MSLALSVDSDDGELLRLSDWLAGERPVLDINEQCVNACAWLVLNSGRALTIRGETLIAFDATNF